MGARVEAAVVVLTTACAVVGCRNHGRTYATARGQGGAEAAGSPGEHQAGASGARPLAGAGSALESNSRDTNGGAPALAAGGAEQGRHAGGAAANPAEGGRVDGGKSRDASAGAEAADSNSPYATGVSGAPAEVSGRCGDGTLDPGEPCDTSPRKSCHDLNATFHADAGLLECTDSCLFDTSRCVWCGDGMKNGPEQCDGDVGSRTCHDIDPRYYEGIGVLGCSGSCVWDTDACRRCGDGIVDGNETCDPLESCPIDCPPVGCQLRVLVNDGTCRAACVNDAVVSECQDDDRCCPQECSAGDDSDCAAVCGDAADGICPPECVYEQDLDCKKGAGEVCEDGGECASADCPDGYCCTQTCGPCQQCTGENGTCVPVINSEDPGTCSGSNLCNGDGVCKRKDGVVCAAASDCASGVAATGYRDSDNDGYTSTATELRCGTSVPHPTPTAQLDCCDSDANAHPGATDWHSYTNNCGSWDYDCDGVESPQAMSPSDEPADANGCRHNGCASGSPAQCCTGFGWVSAKPACGQSGTYRSCSMKSGSPGECFEALMEGLYPSCR